MKWYKPKHFVLQEFIPPQLYQIFPEERCWEFLDQDLLIAIDDLRDYLGKPIYANTWHMSPFSDDTYEDRGFRMPGSTVGAYFSQHRFGRALDFHVDELSANEVREIILRNQNKWAEISALEAGVSWIHWDTRMKKHEGIWVFYPETGGGEDD